MLVCRSVGVSACLLAISFIVGLSVGVSVCRCVCVCVYLWVCPWDGFADGAVAYIVLDVDN